MDSSIDTNSNKTRSVEAIVRQYQSGLLRYVERLVGSSDAAQDVVQDVFVKLIRRPRLIRTAKSDMLRHWLYRVAHNEAIDHVRRVTRFKAMQKRVAQHTEVAKNFNKDLEKSEKCNQVLSLIHRLKPAEQQVLLLRLEEGFSYKDISRITGRTIGNVGCLLHMAVKTLAGMLRKQNLLTTGPHQTINPTYDRGEG